VARFRYSLQRRQINPFRIRYVCEPNITLQGFFGTENSPDHILKAPQDHGELIIEANRLRASLALTALHLPTKLRRMRDDLVQCIRMSANI
jgi:hypothetical protein